MDKMTFASYKFKPSDVIEGLNRYFAESKAFRYRRVPLEIRNGEVKPGNYYVFRNIVFGVFVPKIKECGYGYILCDPEEVVGVAINWLREKHDIFYTPGMEVPVEDFDVDEAAREYEKATRTSDIFCEGSLDMVPVAKVREALGIAEDSDIFEAIRVLKKSDERAHSEMHKARGEKYELERRVREILGSWYDEHSTVLDMKDDILKVYREIFDCSNGDPEGSDEETLQDILTEYKRTLALKNAAEEKTIKYKELARENEEKLAKEKEWTKRLEQKLIEIQDICER